MIPRHPLRAAVLRAACALLLALAAAAPTAAQFLRPEQGPGALDGRVIRDVEITGLTTLPEDTLLYYLGLEVGERYDAGELNWNIRQLWERELIDDIEVEAIPEGDSVRLRVRVEERPILRSVEYEGLKRVSRSEILDEVTKERIRVREGSPLSRGALYRLKDTIEGLYRQKGFRLAEASFELVPVESGEYRVVFTIDEGDKVRIGDIDFEGNTVFRDIRLRWVMKETKESGLITRVMKKDIYNPANLEEDLDKVAELYRDTGYKNVALGEPAIEVRSKDGDAAPEEAAGKKRRLAITIPLEEGQRWQFGDVHVEGNETFRDEILLGMFKQPRGGWLRSSAVDKGVEAISELYSNTGHLFAQVETELRERDEQVADVYVHIDEGDQFRVGRIEFEGNTRTKDKVLRREMRVQEGMILNAAALRNSLRRIGQLEYFQVDEEEPVDFDFDPEEQNVDILVNGAEGDRTELQVGGGWSEIDGFFGQFSIRTRNFLGRGESVGISIQTGRFRDLFDLSYFAPWFLDRPQTVGIQLFQRDLDYSLLSGQTFFQKSTGATLTYGRNVGTFNSVTMSYSRFDSEDRRRLLSFDGSIVEQEFVRDVSSIRTAFTRNTIDSRLDPTNGQRFTASVEVAGGVLQGNTNFVRPQVGYTLFTPVTRGRVNTVFSVNAEAGYIEPYGDQELFFLDRFYLGGENSLRGFRFRSIWVRDEDGNTVIDEFGTPLGGNSFVQFNVEYHLLLGGPFRVLGFFDAANVYAEGQTVDVADLRYTAGIEFRLFVPVFGQPLRFILARNLDPLTDDRFESFQFSIGAGF